MLSNRINEKTVLIVEDSATQALQLQHLLSEHGLSPIWARDGEDGLHCAQFFRPNVIILDIELPGMNGFQLCKYLKEGRYTSAIPIILLTHLNYREIAKYGIDANGVSYITKNESSGDVILKKLKVLGLIFE